MKVNIQIEENIKEPHVSIYTDRITEVINSAAAYLRNLGSTALSAEKNGRIYLIEPEQIYLITIESRKTFLHTKTETLHVRKRLYEMEGLLPEYFVKISKSVLVNRRYIWYVESGLQGMQVIMKNGNKEYISRTYYKSFKTVIGID